MAVSQLWKDYSERKTVEVRNQLVLAYIDLVGFQIRNLPVPQGLDADDLRQLGLCGLIRAVEKYDPSKGAKFETYAGFRIRGAVLDQLRVHGQVTKGASRSVVEKSKRVSTATRELEQKLQRHPTSQEIAEHIGLELDEYYKLLGDIGNGMSLSLDELVGTEENLSLVHVIKNDESPDPMEELMSSERFTLLERSLDELPDNLKTVITLYYHQEFTFKEIGQVVGLTVARISQLHTEAILRLRAKLNRD